MKNIGFLKSNLIAHRGLHSKNIVENTISAFVKAINMGFIIELDVHILTDNNIVVYHDYDLKRLSNINKIIETFNYKDLSKIKIKNKYKIPTLNQVLNIVNGKVPIIIEVKDMNNNEKFYQILANILDNYNGEFAIQSMNPKVLDWFYKNRPNYIIGLIIFNDLNYKIFKKYTKKIDFLTVYKKQLPFKNKNMIIGWTIKNKKEYEKYKPISDNLICENILEYCKEK